MANAGMDLKSLQYLMGHSDAGVAMNVYTHASYDHAEQSMQKIFSNCRKRRLSRVDTGTQYLHQIYTRGAKSYVNLHQFMKSEPFQKVRISNNNML